jgi:hypothetical protein
LNLGVRWEPYTTPSEVNGLIANLRHISDTAPTLGGPYFLNQSWGNIGPRIGFAWSPSTNGKTSVRGGFALLFEPNDPNQYYIAATRLAPLYPTFNGIPDTGHFPDALAEIAAVTNSFGTAEGIPYDNNKSPHALQYNLTVQQQIGASSVFSLGYTGSRGIDLLSTGEYDSPRAQFDGVSLAIPARATLVNPLFAGIQLFSNNANSWYNAFTFAFQKRLSAGFQAQVAYTFSKLIAEADGGSSSNGVNVGGSGQLKYSYDMKANKSLGAYDFRNQLRVNYSYDLPLARGMTGMGGRLLSGWQWTGILTVQSGQPSWLITSVPSALSALFVPTRSPNLVAGLHHNQIILGKPNLYYNPAAFSAPATMELGNVGRNTIIGPGLATWDMGLNKTTKISERMNIEFRGELFNLLNRANFASPASTVFTGTGGRVGNAGVITSTVTTSRQVQFALKLLF